MHQVPGSVATSEESQSQSSASFFDPDVSKCSDASSVFNVSLDGESSKGPDAADPMVLTGPKGSKEAASHAQNHEGQTHFQVCAPLLALAPEFRI